MQNANLFMACLFLACAAMQYNDPDPALWVGIYGAAALLSIVAFRGWVLAPLTSMLSVITLSGGTVLVDRVIGKQSLFQSEEGREMMGLFLVAFWMGVLTVKAVMKAQREAKAEDFE